jgi:hypothetical protein
MKTINRGIHINQIVNDPENTGRADFALIISIVINKAKDNQSFVMNLQNRSIMIGVNGIILNKLVIYSLACATRKASQQKQSP